MLILFQSSRLFSIDLISVKICCFNQFKFLLFCIKKFVVGNVRNILKIKASSKSKKTIVSINLQTKLKFAQKFLSPLLTKNFLIQILIKNMLHF